MTSEYPYHIAQQNRIKDERLRLEGNECSICGAKHFPPTPVCYDCTPVGEGVVELVVEQTVNGKREVELGVKLVDDNIQVRINLNGKSHSIKFQAGMRVPVFTKRFLKEKEEPTYYANTTSLSSK